MKLLFIIIRTVVFFVGFYFVFKESPEIAVGVWAMLVGFVEAEK